MPRQSKIRQIRSFLYTWFDPEFSKYFWSDFFFLNINFKHLIHLSRVTTRDWWGWSPPSFTDMFKFQTSNELPRIFRSFPRVLSEIHDNSYLIEIRRMQPDWVKEWELSKRIIHNKWKSRQFIQLQSTENKA